MSEERLDGWKAIARYLGRDERTVRRWEANGLPVHRLPGGPRAPVFALRAELDGWVSGSGGAPVPTPIGAAENIQDAGATDGTAPEDTRRAPPYRLVSAAALLALAAAWLALTSGAGWSLRRPAHTPLAASSNEAGEMRLPADARARQAFLDGQHAWTLRTATSLKQALQDYSDAIGRDPAFAPAYVGLANTYLLMREFAAMPDFEAYPKAEAATLAALKLDPQLAAAHRARGFVLYWWRHDPEAAWAAFERAAALDPRDALTWHWYATALQNSGAPVKAVAMIARARALDPSSSAIVIDEGFLLYEAGRHAEGRAQIERAASLDPGNADAHRYLARIAREEGRAADAARELEREAVLRGMQAERQRDLE